jgi:hypothetical protein
LHLHKHKHASLMFVILCEATHVIVLGVLFGLYHGVFDSWCNKKVK